MAQDLSIATHYLSKASGNAPLDPLANEDLLYAKDGSLRICYAPFDYIPTSARLAIVGITPGMTQAVNALIAARNHLSKNAPMEEVLRHAKMTASFSGAMRNNLVAMLDALGVNGLFGVASTASLFGHDSEDVHFTSALRYPVFVDGRNYNGSPNMLKTPLLLNMVETFLAEEVRQLPDAIWLPLGPKAEAAVMHLARHGQLDPARVLAGMPHPSGANAERIAVFLGRKSPDRVSRQTNSQSILAARSKLEAQIAELRKGKE